jgi:hypothetical protein
LDLPLRPDGDRAADAWVATIWPDPAVDHDWVGLVWVRGTPERGCHVPTPTHLDDVWEFAADLTVRRGRWRPRRWYSYLAAWQSAGAVVVGGYPNLTGGLLDADGWLDQWRLAEFDATRRPAAPGSDPTTSPVTAAIADGERAEEPCRRGC